LIYNSVGTYLMVKKGKIEEIFSRALYADNPLMYTVTYRDFEGLKQVNLNDFIALSESFQLIPVSRIIKIQKGKTILYQKHVQ
jgi:hypothetical protein